MQGKGPNCYICACAPEKKNIFKKGKELSFCRKLYFSKLYIFATQSRRPLMFQTMNSVMPNNLSLKYQRFTSSDCKDIGINQFEFLTKTQLLWSFNLVRKVYKKLVATSKSMLYKKMKNTHSCILSPLAPDPIRVQSCVWCLFWTYRISLAVKSFFLSISLSNQSYESCNRRYQ